MNTITIHGRLAADPELKTTPTGKKVCTVSIACNRKYSKDKEQQTDFINCVFWNEAANFLANYFQKGQEILLLNGELQIRSYQDQSGNKRYVTEVVNAQINFCGSKTGGNNNNTASTADFEEQDANEEDVPF